MTQINLHTTDHPRLVVMGRRHRQCRGCSRPMLIQWNKSLLKRKGLGILYILSMKRGFGGLKEKDDGSCFFLPKENKFSIYDIRMPICRLEPFTITDYDPEKNKIELTLDFPFTCFCEGVGTEGAVPIEVIGKSAQGVMNKILELTAKEMGLPVNDKKVRFAARAKLLASSRALS